MTAGLLLALSWLICWYFFFIRYAPAVAAPSRASWKFASTSYAAFALLAAWSAAMWGIAPQVPPAPLAAAGLLLTVAGQWLMCAARRALPLSNKDALMRISATRVQSGVYRRLAHPMYIGLLVALAGSSFVLGNSWALLLLPALAALLALRAVIESAHDI